MQITNIKEQILKEIKDFIAAENRSCRLSGFADGSGSSESGGFANDTGSPESCTSADGSGSCGVRGYPDPAGAVLWQEPLVGFADVAHPYIRSLREIVHPNHQMPEEVMPNASIIIAYFVPFAEWLPKTNKVMDLSRTRNADGLLQTSNAGDLSRTDHAGALTETSPRADLASPEWAESYELTNAMFGRLNEHIIETVHKLGYEAATAPEAGVFHRDEITSYWSFRHIAYAAGLGTFGLNNMLITEKGCAGRFNTVVTSLPVDRVIPGEPRKQEACLYKRIGSCRLCMKKCPVQAIAASRYDRKKCFGQCLENAAVYNTFGSSYASTAGDEPEAGSEVCGKCLSGLPCTYKIP